MRPVELIGQGDRLTNLMRSVETGRIVHALLLEGAPGTGKRTAAGWTYAPRKDVEGRQSPYLVDWDDLPDRAREWNRSATRDIPGLLASVGLAISR